MQNAQEVPLAYVPNEQDITGAAANVNVMPILRTTGGKYPFKLGHSPGLDIIYTLPTFPVLALHTKNQRSFAVTPTKFYELYKDGTFTERGDCDMQGPRVEIDSNGNQVCWVDGIKGFYFDYALITVNEIVDPAFYPATHVAYQDGYFIFNRVGTDQFFLSDLLAVTFDPLNFATAEGQPDNLRAVISDHRELFLFGSETIEVWYNSGDPDFPFDRNQGAFVEKGLAGPYTVAKQDNTVFFVGSDLRVYALRGYTPDPISNDAVEADLEGVDTCLCYAYTYFEDGQLFYKLFIPDSDVTWVYEVTTNTWHRRAKLDGGMHQSNCKTYFNKMTLVGDNENGNIYNMTRKVFWDADVPRMYNLTLPTIYRGRDLFSIENFELDMTTGAYAGQDPNFGPEMQLRVSKDGGNTWGGWKTEPIGKLGEYEARARWFRFGTARDFVIQCRCSENMAMDIGGAWIK
jgi:hypothetical protein